jgi:hypothetical protein
MYAENIRGFNWLRNKKKKKKKKKKRKRIHSFFFLSIIFIMLRIRSIRLTHIRTFTQKTIPKPEGSFYDDKITTVSISMLKKEKTKYIYGSILVC